MFVTAFENNILKLSFVFFGFFKKMFKKDEGLVFLCYGEIIIRFIVRAGRLGVSVEEG